MNDELCVVRGPDAYPIDQMEALKPRLDRALLHAIWLGVSVFALDGDTGFTRLAAARIAERDNPELRVRAARAGDEPAWCILCGEDGSIRCNEKG